MNVLSTDLPLSLNQPDECRLSGLRGFARLVDKSLLRGIRCFLSAFITGGEYSTGERESRFEEIVRVHSDIISRICFGYARTRTEYDDLRQDSLINIWQGLSTFRAEASLRTWIYRVTLNTCVSTLRKRDREINTTQLNELYDAIDEPDQEKEMLAELHQCIDSLSPTDKAVILLWLEGLSYEDMAAMTGLGRNTLATRLKRAKEKISNIHLNQYK